MSRLRITRALGRWRWIGGTRRRGALSFVIAIWLALIGAGSVVLVDYGAAPGIAASAPSRWPSDSRIERPGDLPELVMLVHPFCPCSRASVAELERLMARLDGRVRATVVMLEPGDDANADAALREGGLRSAAAAIPGVRVIDDPGGHEAQRFGGFTSGQTFLYDAEGKLRFAGGITDARGHEGGNAGVDAIAAAVLDGSSGIAAAPVYGCSLVGPHGSVGTGSAS